MWIFTRFSLLVDEDHLVEMAPEIILRAKYGIKLKIELLSE